MQTRFYAFALYFVISFGISTGLVYSVVLYHAWLFFPGKEGLVTGIVIAGFGLGGAVFITLSSELINPGKAEA